jgi:hypothetical protein
MADSNKVTKDMEYGYGTRLGLRFERCEKCNSVLIPGRHAQWEGKAYCYVPCGVSLLKKLQKNSVYNCRL